MTDNTIADLQATVANAVEEYADQNGDGLGNLDWAGANEYRDEGFRLGEAAMLFDDADHRETFIDTAVGYHPASARYLISWAATLRIAELEREAKMRSEGFVYYRGMKMTADAAEAQKARDASFFNVACEIVGGGA